jgi:hypothetical protein
MRICPDDLFSIQLQDQSKHTVSSWMLWTEIHSVMSDFPVLCHLALLSNVGIAVILWLPESFVYWN